MVTSSSTFTAPSNGEQASEQVKHTPGPWRLKTEARTPDYNHPYMRLDAGDGVGDDDGRGGFHLSGIVAKEDATLIASAPELIGELDACITALFEAAVIIEDRFPRTATLFSAAATRARAVADKARGRYRDDRVPDSNSGAGA